MPVSDRDYVRGEHPPTCTCKECTDRRLARLTGQSSDKGREKTPRRTKPISVHSNIPPFFSQTIRGTPLHRIWKKIPLSVRKLFLSLLVTTGLVDIIRRGYTLFTHQTDPIKNTIIFLVEVGLWFWIIAILRSRRYKYRKAKFKLVFITVIAITLVCAFAGIEPMSSIKDKTISSIEQGWQTIMAPSQSSAPAPVKPTPVPVEPVPTPMSPPTPMKPPVIEREQLVQYALQLINKDRKENSLPAVALGNNTAAQEHAEDMLKNNYFSHWGMDGMKPYMRYTLAGGFNYEQENVFTVYTIWIGGKDPSYKIDPMEMLDEAENELMTSPGHRKNILYKWHKKINLGIAYDQERLTLVQQFEGDYVKFNELPILQNGLLSFSGEVLDDFQIKEVHVWYDPLPHSLTLGQLAATYAYSIGSKPAVFIVPPAPPGSYYASSVTTYSYEVPLDPYEVSPDAPVRDPSPFSVQIRPVPFLASSQVRLLEAKYWDILGKEFSITANLSDIISEFGDGVYTVLIWGEKGDESIRLTNYAIWVQ